MFTGLPHSLSLLLGSCELGSCELGDGFKGATQSISVSFAPVRLGMFSGVPHSLSLLPWIL
jgi:hypothetical protein